MTTPARPPATAPVRRRRHLMDPDNLQPVHDRAAAQRSLTRVQRWVGSSLAVTTILHLSAGLVIAALFLSEPRLSAQIGLNVVAMAFGVVAVAVGLAIHRQPILSWWLALGVIPGIVGLYLTLG